MALEGPVQFIAEQDVDVVARAGRRRGTVYEAPERKRFSCVAEWRGPMTRELSVVIPVYNGAATVAAVVESLLRELDDVLLEIILVNDGSPDRSEEVCEKLALRHTQRVKYVELARNYSEHNAVLAGLRYTAGAYIVVVDDDNQNPASEVRKLFEEIRKGFDVVYSCYGVKKHVWWRNLGSDFNNLVATIMLRKPRDLYLSSFKIMNRFVVDCLGAFTNPHPYIDGLIFQVTDRIGRVQVEHRQRVDGRSNYTLRRLVSLWLNMFTNFSILPLRLATWIGFVISVFGLGLGLAIVAEKIANPALPMGYPSLMVSVLVIGGIQCFLLGMLGEYLGRMFMSVNQKPQYVVRRTSGWEPDRGAETRVETDEPAPPVLEAKQVNGSRRANKPAQSPG